MNEFTREVVAERARLALVDPVGEQEAVAPLTGVRARQTLLAQADEARRRRERIRIRGPIGAPVDWSDVIARLEALPKAKKSMTGAGWHARCPAHEDRSPSLSWRVAPDGKVLMHCHAGCSFRDVMAAIR